MGLRSLWQRITMPVDMDGRSRHHGRPPKQPAVEWDCPSCGTTQVGRFEDGCSNALCPTHNEEMQRPRMVMSEDEADRVAGRQTVDDAVASALDVLKRDDAAVPDAQQPAVQTYRLLYVSGQAEQVEALFPLGVSRVSDDLLVVAQEVYPDDQIWSSRGEDQDLIRIEDVFAAVLREEQEEAAKAAFLDDERALIQFAIDLIEQRAGKAGVVIGGQQVTKETAKRLRERLG